MGEKTRQKRKYRAHNVANGRDIFIRCFCSQYMLHQIYYSFVGVCVCVSIPLCVCMRMNAILSPLYVQSMISEI